MTTPLSPQVQEWRDKAMKLADDHALWYSQSRDEPNAARRAALLAHISAVPFNQVVPEGWKLVPLEPTEAMQDAACDDVGLCADDKADDEVRQEYRVAYRAMVAASPQPVSQPGEPVSLLKRIVGLCHWDEDGATEPVVPGLSWESIARMAMDIARSGVPGEALPAEQPKSKIAYPVVSVGEINKTALAEDGPALPFQKLRDAIKEYLQPIGNMVPRDEVVKRHFAAHTQFQAAAMNVHTLQALLKDSDRLWWLHALSTNNPDAAGYEWGVFRVKWEDGRVADIRRTLADHTDLDAAMAGAACEAPAGSAGFSARSDAAVSQPGEALPAEQPKSDKSYPVVAVGSDLPPALPEETPATVLTECAKWMRRESSHYSTAEGTGRALDHWAAQLDAVTRTMLKEKQCK